MSKSRSTQPPRISSPLSWHPFASWYTLTFLTQIPPTPNSTPPFQKGPTRERNSRFATANLQPMETQGSLRPDNNLEFTPRVFSSVPYKSIVPDLHQVVALRETKRRSTNLSELLDRVECLGNAQITWGPTPKRNACQKGVKTLPQPSTTPMGQQPVATINQNLAPGQMAMKAMKTFPVAKFAKHSADLEERRAPPISKGALKKYLESDQGDELLKIYSVHRWTLACRELTDFRNQRYERQLEDTVRQEQEKRIRPVHLGVP
ncbi:hypothetical protein G7Y89_g14932 [Cudoniella acicularis]|uniref:Uncharacterized protein n=1 Tax=Cudoniella acicularis TaxID=354080 RepID=A0A8H4VPP0_9HELO|nr:hypothetical protein G7Y89_g14932 [Cudoniella acicularis]